jgi:hypothetical protein
VSPVRYEPGFYIPEDGILHSHRRENLKSYIFSELCNICPGLGISSVSELYGQRLFSIPQECNS